MTTTSRARGRARDQAIAFAGWMLERLRTGPHHDALNGDLLEELRGGRSVGWYWRQVITAIGVALAGRMRRVLGPAWFSSAWSLLYPAWVRCFANMPVSAARWEQMNWPYSAGFKIVSGIVPGVAFVWLGLMVYLVASGAVRDILRFRFFLGLSISLNVLLAGIFLSFRIAGHAFQEMNREQISGTSNAASACVVVGASLLAAIVSVRARSGSRRRADSVVGV